jgi:uncharacterized membrane protein YebE (DUF533 family)
LICARQFGHDQDFAAAARAGAIHPGETIMKGGAFDAGDLLSRMLGGGASGGKGGGLGDMFGAKGGGGKGGGDYGGKADWGDDHAKGGKKGWDDDDGAAVKSKGGFDDTIAAAKKYTAEKAAMAKEKYQSGGVGAVADYVGGEAAKGIKTPVGAGIAGAIAGAAAGSLGRSWGGTAMRLGGLALIGGLAYAAWNRYRAAQGGAQPPAQQAPAQIQPPPQNSAFAAPAAGDARNAMGVLMIGAMIQAAKADGQIDAAEMQKIFGEMSQQQIAPTEKAFLMEEMGKPIDVATLAGQATSPEIASQIYAASAIVVGAQNAQETQYLQSLAQALRIDSALAQAIHQQIAAQPAAA